MRGSRRERERERERKREIAAAFNINRFICCTFWNWETDNLETRYPKKKERV